MEDKVWVWTARRERAAVMVAAGKLTTGEIASLLEITPRCLQLWKNEPEFAKRVEENVRQFAREFKNFAITNSVDRVAAKQKRWAAFNGIMDARASAFGGLVEDEAVVVEPGMDSGLMKKIVTEVGSGAGAGKKRVVTFAPDYELSKAMDALEGDVAKELGQIAPSRTEHTGAGGGPIRVTDEPDLSGLTMEELLEYERLLSKAVPGAGEAALGTVN